MNILSKYILCLLLLATGFCFSQNENKKWCFATQVGLDFMTTPPTLFTASGIQVTNASSSISDAAGNLLFYSDGVTIQNQLHTLMANGNNIAPSTGYLGQFVLIAKQPGNNPFYYVFTTNPSLCYSIVDMSLAAGIGSVTIKSSALTTIPSSQKVAGTWHCNGKDIWIVSQDNLTNTTRAYLLTSSGLNTVPVLSTTPFINRLNGGLKFSSFGNKLASCDFVNTVHLYDFNTATGTVSGGIQVGSGLITDIVRTVEFSPDGTKLYGVVSGLAIYQWDLCSGSSTTLITASQYTVYAGGTIKYAAQAGPDGKIYIARDATQALAVINNPNVAGAGCNYVETGQSIAPEFCSFGLPNSIKPRLIQGSFSHTVSAGSCQTVSYTTSMFPGGIVTCMSTSATPVWNFGDAASGANNSSNALNPTHTYSGPGTYTVMLILNYTCGVDTLKQVITIGAASPTLSISGNINLCGGQSTTLTATGATNYTWTGNGSSQTGSLITVNSSPPGTVIYTVTSNGINSCPGQTLVTLTVLPNPTLTLNGGPFVCAGSNATLSVSGAATYTWNTGSNSSSIVVNGNTFYQVNSTGSNGCVKTETLMTILQALPVFSVNSATTCVGNPVTLSASGSNTLVIIYSWLPGGGSGNSITVSPSVSSTYSLTGNLNGCESHTTASVTIKALEASITTFSYSSPVCMSSTLSSPFLTTGFSQGGNFSSLDSILLGPSSGQIDASQSQPGLHQVTYTLPQIGCTAGGQYTSEIIIIPSPTLTVTPLIKVAPGETATLSANSNAISFSWSPSSDLSCPDCQDPVVAPFENKEYCVSVTNGSCAAHGCVYVLITCDKGFDFSMPNAFSPDGNGLNDRFCIQGWNTCLKSFEVSILNRWGEVVFHSNDPAFCWDGSYKGKLLDPDVFVYQVRAIYNDKKMVNKKGNITLLR